MNRYYSVKFSLLSLPILLGYLCGFMAWNIEPRTKAQTPCTTPPSLTGMWRTVLTETTPAFILLCSLVPRL